MSKKNLTIYHNSRCSKSRCTLELVEKSGSEHRIINYLETPPSPAELEQLLQQLDMEPDQIVRRGEDRYEELKLDQSPPKTRAEWIRTLCENPILIERPIVTDGKHAVIGRPPENVLKLL